MAAGWPSPLALASLAMLSPTTSLAGLTSAGLQRSHRQPRLMATLPPGSVAGVAETLLVFEDLTDAAAPIVYRGAKSRFVISKSQESIAVQNQSKLWRGKGAADVMRSQADDLGNELVRDGEPTFEDVAEVLPPVLATHIVAGDYSLDTQSFVGSRIASEKRAFAATGADNPMRRPMLKHRVLKLLSPNAAAPKGPWDGFRQAYHFDTSRLTVNNTKAGLLGGFLPALRWSWELGSGGYVEQIAFATPNSTKEAPFDVSSEQPVWIRFINVTAHGQLRYVHYVDTFEDYPIYCMNASAPDAKAGWSPSQLECDGQNGEGFYAALLTFAMYWNATLEEEQMMTVELPTHGVDIGNFVRHCIVREMITRRDIYHPRYGVPPQAYGSRCCDGFQDVLISSFAMYLEWGLHRSAKGIFDNYYTFYVRRHAKLMYRGPELAQYARMLTQAAQLYQHTGETSLLLKHSEKLIDISDMLLSRRRAAQELPPEDPSYGMIRGQDESDEILVGWTQETTELPHISFSLETWRAFRDLGAVWQQIGAAQGYPNLESVGASLAAEAPHILRDVHHAMELSAVPAKNTTSFPRAPCHPYVAGERSCSLMSEGRVSRTKGPYNPRAQEPWRSYSGMFWSGGLSSQSAIDIVRYNQHNDQLSRLGIWSGGLGFENRLVSFTEQGHGYGLVQHAPADGMAELFVLQLYSEIAHACSRGSWTCFETRGLPNWTPAGGYATPSQTVVPLHVKWMLIFEDPINSTVTLLKTTPRTWLNPGERIAVKRAPLGKGRVSFEVLSRLGDTNPTVGANISFDRPHFGSNSVPLSITLRVPRPWRMKSVLVNSLAWHDFDVEKELVRLPPMRSKSLEVVASYSK